MTRSVLPAAALSALAAAVVPLTAQAPAAPAASSVAVVIKAGRLVDARAGTILTNQAILVEGERIKQVGPGSAVAGHAPAGARVIDLSGATVLPGLIDCHTHITADPGDYYQQLFRQSPIDQAVVAHVFAKRTLEAGFTTIRNVGADEFVDVALRNAINSGVVAGPRMLVSTMPLSATGGHGDVNGFSPYLRFEQASGIANGGRGRAWEVRGRHRRGGRPSRGRHRARARPLRDEVGGRREGQPHDGRDARAVGPVPCRARQRAFS
ncbi:MAG: hypothetical protein AUH78_09065 [Gemmatimonadetes bacterium 13_1_40CM_4_69_8]|nr:MAG: hypothetical protein AUH78_09065 [Gemmatimonadetes bacterium 13_1_40CM_4_69_8]